MESNQALTFIISVLLHGLLLLFLMLYKPQNLLDEPKPPEKWLEFKELKDQPMMAEKTQRVEKQTRTKMTTNSAMSSLEPKESASTSSLRSFNEMREESYGNTQTESPTQPTEGDLFVNQSAQVSQAQRQQIQAYLPPELELGDMVALNTDQNLFFTFYRRMAEKIVWPWAQSVTASFEKMRQQGQLGASRKAWVTILEVLLDRNGNVVSTAPLQLAGEYDIDSAPVRAFKNAKNFPNPPIEMVEEDGYIRIRYKFVVYYNPTR